MSSLLQALSADTGLTQMDLQKIIRTAPKRYKVFSIPKRSGGLREIAQPSRELKLVQRAFIERFLIDLPVHDAARAYRRGLSIRDNAEPHSGYGPLLKMDFKDFFPSITGKAWVHYCTSNPGIIERADLDLSVNILFRKPRGERNLRLSIGAPSSPILCNILLFDFDNSVDAAAKQRGLHYTRYADDLTFSGQRIGMLRDMLKAVEKSLQSNPDLGIRINHDKTVFVTAANRRVVTGVTLTNQSKLSIGYDRKRNISAQVHHAKQGRLSHEQLRALAGLLGFVNVVEPEFVDRLTDKYGNDVIAMIRRC